jgi:hypothetical protein
MLAAVLAAIPSLQQILFGEDNVAFLGIVKVFWVKFRSSEIIVHLAHVCKVNKISVEGFSIAFFEPSWRNIKVRLYK